MPKHECSPIFQEFAEFTIDNHNVAGDAHTLSDMQSVQIVAELGEMMLHFGSDALVSDFISKSTEE